MTISKNRFLSALLALVLLCSVFVINPETAYGATFSDVTKHWAESYIKQATEAGVINGYEDGTFLPDQGITRAEFVRVLNAALKNEGTTSVSFSDTPKGEWYYADVQKAVAAGITQGYEDNTFRPANKITRQEAAVFLSNVVPTYGMTGNLKSFPDYNDVADWAASAMERINGKGYIGAYADDGKLHPTDQLTRAQATKIICDIMNKESIVSGKTEITSSGTSLSGKIYSNGVTIASGVGSGSASISNSVLLGPLTVKGGGDSVTVQNSRVIEAVIDADTDVKVIAKGETNIVNTTVSNSATLEASGLSGGSTFGPGFKTVSSGNKSNIVYTGNFPDIKINGSNSYATFTSGTVENLTVTGKGSAITVETSATLTNVIVDASASFYGNGTIQNMNVNANGVTYAKEPVNLKIANKLKDDDRDDDDDDNLDDDISISPKYKASDVSVGTTIKLTFNEAMTLYNGKAITNSNIEDFVELRSGSSSGKTVSFSAKIDSKKKMITITPNKDLDEDTRYYVIIKKNSIANEDGVGNSAFSSYFNTEDGDSTYATFSPRNKETGVSVSGSLTITMKETVETYDGNTIKSSDLEKYIIVLRKTNSSGANIPFSATISSNKTIKVTPSERLDPGTTYYLAIVKNEMRTKSGKTSIPGLSITFTTTGTSSGSGTLTTPSLTVKNNSTITASSTANTAGTVYGVIYESSEDAPTAKEVKNNATSSNKKTVTANSTVSMDFDKLDPYTKYTVYMVHENKSETLSSVVSASTTTFSDLVLTSDASDSIALSSTDGTTTFDPVWVSGDATTVTVRTDSSFPGTITVNNSSNGQVKLNANGVTNLSIVVKRNGQSSATTYKVAVYRITDISKITIYEGSSNTVSKEFTLEDMTSGNTFEYKLIDSNISQLRVKVTLIDTSSKFKLDGVSSVYQTNNYIEPFTLGLSSKDESVKIMLQSANPGSNNTYSKDKTYTLKITK